MKVDLHRKLDVEADHLELILGQVNNEWILLVKWLSI
jgi:hypothetical protein